MIYFAVTYNNRTRYASSPAGVFNLVEYITGNVPEAANVSSWAEVAAIGEVYEGDTFTVEVTES